jgi:hypothetical protein
MRASTQPAMFDRWDDAHAAQRLVTNSQARVPASLRDVR